MRKIILAMLMFVTFLGSAGRADAHYGMVIPSDTMVMQADNREVNLTLSFSHPFEGIGMVLEKPAQFKVASPSGEKNLLEGLRATRVMDQPAWEADYRIQRPGAYTFYMEPKPYWEPAEDCFIVHHTKTVVAAFGDDEGWDAEMGLKTEIVPLAKPFGLYAGNVFQGVVKLHGKPVPHAEVEVEYYDRKGEFRAPTDYMVTQTIKADAKGVFTYGVPRAGWWGFAALSTSDRKIEHDGEQKDVELGAVLWIRFHDFQRR